MSEIWEITKAIWSLIWGVVLALYVLVFLVASIVYEHKGDTQKALLMIVWAIFANMQVSE